MKIKELLLLLLRLNRLSTKTPECISFQLRILAHYSVDADGLGCNYEMRISRKKPKADLPTVKYRNIQEAIDDVNARIGFYERKILK